MVKTTKLEKMEIVDLYKSGEKDSTELSKMYGVSKSAIIGILKRRGIPRNKRGGKRRKYKHSLNENFFSIENEESMYWAGFIAADGNIHLSKTKNAQKTLTIELSRLDEEHLDKFNIGTDMYFRPSRTPNSLGMCSKSISSDIICNDLLRYNITPKKSLTLEFPTNIKEENIIHFIRGYFDGDGCFNIRTPTVCRYTFLGTEQFLTKIKEYFNINVNIHKKSESNIFYLNYNGVKTCKKIFDSLYDGATIFLNRKKDKAEKFFN